jgi:hypothetical protein
MLPAGLTTWPGAKGYTIMTEALAIIAAILLMFVLPAALMSWLKNKFGG